MKSLLTWLSALLLSGTLLAQTGTAAKDKSSSDPAPATVTAQQLQALQDALAAQQKQINEQQKQIEALRQQLGQQGTPHVADASLHTAAGESSSSSSAARAVVSDAGGGDQPQESPLSFRIGNMDFTPGGFADFTAVFRTTNTGNVVATSFGAIPYSNTVQGHLTENRLSAQDSRLSLKVHGLFGENDVTGYVEADFNGNDPANVFVTSNSHTNRLRLYWLDLHRGKWEFLGGQSWSWLTPNRVGLSPMPADIFFTNNMDTNYQVGLTWTRAAQFRVVYHPTEHWGMGLAIENPQQYVGSGEVIFPFAFNATLGPQFDAANNPGAPNLSPDLIPKIAYDTDINGKHMHVEALGLFTAVKTTFLPVGIPGASFEHATAVGLSGGLGANLEFAKGYRFVASGIWGTGAGRYMIGLGPQAIVYPIQTSPTSFIADASPVHSGSGLLGIEAQVTPNHLLAAYYGGAYFQRNPFLDVTNPVPGRIGGFGGLNSPNSANRALQEATLDWDYTFWQNRNYGKLMLITQWSYVTRAPWFVAAGAPKNAHLFMGWATVRYILP